VEPNFKILSKKEKSDLKARIAGSIANQDHCLKRKKGFYAFVESNNFTTLMFNNCVFLIH
jgi:hypothetical protein